MNNRGKILVSYFSKTGHSKSIAEYIARLIDCDIETIKSQTDISTFSGQFKQSLFSSIGKLSKIYPTNHAVSEYESLIICCPVWCGKIPSSVLTYISQKNGRFKDISIIFSSSKFDNDNLIKRTEKKLGIKVSQNAFITNKDRLKNNQIKMIGKLIENTKRAI